MGGDVAKLGVAQQNIFSGKPTYSTVDVKIVSNWIGLMLECD